MVLTMAKPLYSYDADTQRAKVYHRTTGATVCDVTGVDLYVGNMLANLADQMYKAGYEKGTTDALESLANHIDDKLQRV